MPDPIWAEVDRIFAAASNLQGAERSVLLDTACGQAISLRAEVESLLSFHDIDDNFLHNVMESASASKLDDIAPAAPFEPRQISSMIGKQVGSCRLTRLIASGGMGIVYAAEQEAPRREVAVKLLRADFDAPSFLRRFELEAEVLGHLSHPGVAQIYEVGTYVADDGRRAPYFAMELIVNAQNLLEYAEANRLGVQQRLALFNRVCDAVHHGHQKGIIHRDLKPANILVDESGQPKVIDFGIARASDSGHAGTTLQTCVGQIVGTLKYMSPEQCRGDSRDIDIRSDVYSLGVVLNELLCGRLPYRFNSSAVHEALRVIQEDPPLRPSSTHLELRGDLDTIVLKALEKDRERRYRSAIELAEDLRAYTLHLPIKARPPSLIYNVRLLARRHRFAFTASCIALGSLLVAMVVSLIFWQLAETSRKAEAERATREQAARERAERLFTGGKSLASYVLNNLHQKISTLAGSTAVRKELIEHVQTYLEKLSQDAAGDLELQQEILRSWERIATVLGAPGEKHLGQPELAAVSYRRALAIHARLIQVAPDREAAIINEVACRIRLTDTLWELRRQEEYATELATVRSTLESTPFGARMAPSRSMWLGSCLRRLAKYSIDRGALDETRALFDAALAAGREALQGGPGSSAASYELALTHAELGNFLRVKGDSKAAAAEYRTFSALVEAQSAAGPKETSFDRIVSATFIYLGDALWEEGDPGGALKSYESAQRVDVEAASADPSNVGAQKSLALSSERVGSGLAGTGRRQEAIAKFLESAEIYERLSRRDPSNASLKRGAAVCRGQAAQQLLVGGELEAGIEKLASVYDLQAALLEAAPDKLESQSDVAVTCNTLSEALAQLIARTPALSDKLSFLRQQRLWCERALARYVEMQERGLLLGTDLSRVESLGTKLAQIDARIQALENRSKATAE